MEELWPVRDPEGFVFNLQGIAFMRLSAEGLLWRTRRVAWDGLRNIALSPTELTAEAWALGDTWAPLVVNLRTGRTRGGGYSEPDSAADEVEYEVLSRVHQSCVGEVQRFRERHSAALGETLVTRLMQPVLNEYQRITGADGDDPDHVLKHRLSLYGPPCRACGLPLRTPQAAICAACGTAV